MAKCDICSQTTDKDKLTQVRKVFLPTKTDNLDICPTCETLLNAALDAARSQAVETVRAYLASHLDKPYKPRFFNKLLINAVLPHADKTLY